MSDPAIYAHGGVSGSGNPGRGKNLRVAIVTEYYPSPADPVLGVWAHRQALAVRELGVEVQVIAMRRPFPPERALKPLLPPRFDTHPFKTWLKGSRRMPRRLTMDGIYVEYVPLRAPPRRWSYGSWGLWASPAVRRALNELKAHRPFDLIHAHYATPAGQAALRARTGAPVVVSVHGGDILATVHRSRYARRAVSRTLGAAALVLANSRFSLDRCREIAGPGIAGRVVHLGTDLPPLPRPDEKRPRPTVVTVSHLIPRKRHADVMAALNRLPEVHYLVIGGGPELERLKQLAGQLGLGDRVEFAGQLDHPEALRELGRCHLFAMPSVDEAFGVAYIEAMAAGLPAIGLKGEGGPEEIAAAGGGIELIPPKDTGALASTMRRLLTDESDYRRLSKIARQTVERSFTWKHCGRDTFDAYQATLATDAPARSPSSKARL